MEIEAAITGIAWLVEEQISRVSHLAGLYEGLQPRTCWSVCSGTLPTAGWKRPCTRCVRTGQVGYLEGCYGQTVLGGRGGMREQLLYPQNEGTRGETRLRGRKRQTHSQHVTGTISAYTLHWFLE